MVEITSIILHYNRIENVRRVIEGIRKQIPSKIIVWDNSHNYPKGSGEDVLISSTENFYCLPRLLISGLVQTKYTFWQDDDKAINTPDLFQKLIDECQKQSDYWIGWNGRLIEGIKNWDMAYQSPGGGFVGKINKKADIVNTGISFFETSLINSIPLNPYGQLSENEYKYGDDIWISRWLEKKRIIDFMENSFDDLDEGNGLSKQSEHMNIRNKLVRRFFQ